MPICGPAKSSGASHPLTNAVRAATRASAIQLDVGLRLNVTEVHGRFIYQVRPEPGAIRLCTCPVTRGS